MKTICEFNLLKDVGRVFEGLAPDIQRLMDTHQVTDTCENCVYNNISELKDVGFRVNDEFEAMMLQRSFLAKGASSINKGTGSSQGPSPVSE